MHWSDRAIHVAEWHDQIGLTTELTSVASMTALSVLPNRLRVVWPFGW
jgi:hypothetical protein